DGGRGEQAHVGDQPLDAVLGKESHAVARLHAGLDEGRRAGQGVGPVLLPGQVVEDAAAAVAQGRPGPEALGLAAGGFDQVAGTHGAFPRERAGRSRPVWPYANPAGAPLARNGAAKVRGKTPWRNGGTGPIMEAIARHARTTAPEAAMNDDQARRTKQRESFLTIFLTLIAGAGILLFLIAVSGGFFFYVLLAVVGLVLFGYLHYVLW